MAMFVSQNHARIDRNVRRDADAYMVQGYSKQIAKYEEKMKVYDRNASVQGRERPIPLLNQFKSIEVIVTYYLQDYNI